MDWIGTTSIMIALISIVLSIYTYQKSSNNSSYIEVDKQYLELLKLALDAPYLRSDTLTTQYYKLSSTDEKRMKYDIYAYMCWNLLETIYDMQKSKKGEFKLSETWLPVLFEENRLHYTWFRQNGRLFKKEFQQFVKCELNNLEVSFGDNQDLLIVYKSMESAFPKNERKELAHIQAMMNNGRYHLILAKHKVFGEHVGYAFVHDIEKSDFVWLDYMAIEPKYQNSGYGSILFNKIVDLYQKDVQGILLEVELPGNEQEAGYIERIKRLKFYERLNVKKIPFPYYFPTYTGEYEMQLMVKPIAPMNRIPKAELRQSIAASFEYIHSDIPHRERVLKRFLHHIDDVNLT